MIAILVINGLNKDQWNEPRLTHWHRMILNRVIRNSTICVCVSVFSSLKHMLFCIRNFRIKYMEVSQSKF